MARKQWNNRPIRRGRIRTKAKEKANGRVQILHTGKANTLNNLHSPSIPSWGRWRSGGIDQASLGARSQIVRSGPWAGFLRHAAMIFAPVSQGAHRSAVRRKPGQALQAGAASGYCFHS
jgi:hypothetical protein